MSLKSPNIKTWMVSFLKHFSWMFAKVFISGKLFAEVLILCKILKRGFPQGIILLFSFIFLLMPPINHEHLQRCQRAACLCNCKWQAMNNAHGSCREALTPAACCRWGLACPPSDDPLPWAWFLPGVGELCAGQSPGIPSRGAWVTVHGVLGATYHQGIWRPERRLPLPKEWSEKTPEKAGRVF